MIRTKLIDQVHRIFATADQLKLDEWIVYFVEDARFQFGNAKPITGHDAIRSTMAQFFSAIKAMHHDFDGMYQQDDVVIAEANVMFTRLDDKVVHIPAVTIFRMQGNLIQDFRLYMDVTPVFA
jgi:limonene-1,2-epoxide hydrolase